MKINNGTNKLYSGLPSLQHILRSPENVNVINLKSDANLQKLDPIIVTKNS